MSTELVAIERIIIGKGETGAEQVRICASSSIPPASSP